MYCPVGNLPEMPVPLLPLCVKDEMMYHLPEKLSYAGEAESSGSETL
jgi:hypothetical protein